MWPIFLVALLVSVEGRAVNISNTWVLPEEGFPVFYRYFRDRISWYEADAVCQFHHANLVTVDTTAQYDAVRAYLKELDILSAVWVGLIRSNPEGDFTWTDYRGLSSDGYWSSAPDSHAAPLCAAADPAADYRWEARACGGPTVASFICELPVPQWALGNEGCMVRALPALTVLYLPESAAVQLTADCGLAGVKRVQCTGNVKHEDLLKNLSCNEDDELTTVQNGSSWSITTDTAFTEQDTTEYTTQENCVTEDQQLTSSSTIISSITADNTEVAKPKNKLNKVFLQKAFNLNAINDNNLQSNDIPKLLNSESFLTNEESQKLKDEKNMQHKMLHEELARLGNYETVFSQPTDHFIPPLVMAKARISDDMTVLSLEEKHAQQMAAQKLSKHVFDSDKIYKSNINDKSSFATLDNSISNKNDITTTYSPLKEKNIEKKDKAKLPKKYNEKLNDPKAKSLKALDLKSYRTEKPSTTTETTHSFTENHVTNKNIPVLSNNLTKSIETSTKPLKFLNQSEDDPAIDLTIIIKEPGAESEQQVFYSNNTSDITKLEKIKNETLFYVEHSHNSKNSSERKQNISLISDINDDKTFVHEVIKISIVNDKNTSNPAPLIFEVTTMAPVFKDENASLTTFTSLETTTGSIKTTESNPFTSPALYTNVNENKTVNINSTTEHHTSTASVPLEIQSKYESTLTTIILTTQRPTNTINYINTTIESPLKVNTNMIVNVTMIETGNNNETEGLSDDLKNVTSEVIDDFQSPLLSGANEPIHRPNRLRRLQTPKKIKFNPFRILG